MSKTLLREIHERRLASQIQNSHYPSWWDRVASFIPASSSKNETNNVWGNGDGDGGELEVVLVKRASDDGFCVIQPIRSLSHGHKEKV